MAQSYRAVRFHMDGEPMDASEVFSDVGFMPALAHIADQRSQALFGFSLRLIYSDTKGGLFGTRVSFGAEDWRKGVACVLVAQVAEEVLGVGLADQDQIAVNMAPVYRYFHENDQNKEEAAWPLAELTRAQ